MHRVCATRIAEFEVAALHQVHLQTNFIEVSSPWIILVAELVTILHPATASNLLWIQLGKKLYSVLASRNNAGGQQCIKDVLQPFGVYLRLPYLKDSPLLDQGTQQLGHIGLQLQKNINPT